MMKSMPGLPKLVQHFGRLRRSIWDRSGIRRHKAESIQICNAANTVIRMRNLDSLPTACQKTEPLPYKLSLKTSKDQLARQDSRHRSPEKSRDADCTYSSGIGTVRMDRS